MDMLRTTGLLLAILVLLPLPAAGQSAPAAPAAPTGELSLRPGDVVQVTIWREEDLSGEFPVDENGYVVFPLLGERQVAGVPIRELRESLLEEYRVHLRNPSIMIVPLRRINVLGEVHKPGLYNVDPTISLAGVVAMAGGATPSGDLNRIRIIRSGNPQPERVSATSTLQVIDLRSGDQLLVERRGWFDRNSTFVVSALLSVTSIIISLAR